MKVYELITALCKCDAGANVYVQRGFDKFMVDLECVNNEGTCVCLIGDGEEPGKDDVQP